MTRLKLSVSKIIMLSFFICAFIFGQLQSQAQPTLFGMTSAGGNQFGSIFGIPTGGTSLSSQYIFEGISGQNPRYSNLIQALNGKLYGMTYEGGSNNVGVLFEYDAATNTYTKKVDFSTTNGAYPIGSLIQASNGKLYGMTSQGGANYGGVLFEYDAATNVYTKKFDFSYANGASPNGSLIQASNGKLYGMTSSGGINFRGVLFEYDLGTNVYTKKFEFSGADGAFPYGSLIKASNGKLYGMTSEGGSNNVGVLFEYDLGIDVYTKKFDFSSADGRSPFGSLIQASNGKLYGMTFAGGASGLGVLFEFDAGTNVYTKKFDFSSANGENPEGSLLQASNGKLYGMTKAGGASGLGVLFEYDVATNVYTKKFDFSSADGHSPFGSLIQASNGKLYGMTSAGGAYYSGVLFEYDAATDVYTKKVDFSKDVNGANPWGSLLQASNGKLYGMTSRGGTNNSGVLFEYDAATDVYTKKVDFSTTNNGGVFPYGSLLQASNGKLYGMTGQGGTSDAGVLFEYDAGANVYTKKFDFSSADGAFPLGSLIQASNGKLYGMTGSGGTNASGVLFEYDAGTNVYTKKFDFSSANGANPKGSLIQASNGKLYGMTSQGGTGGAGVLFEYDAGANVYTKKFDFSSADGAYPYGSLLQASNGKLYGMTSNGGINFGGVLFEYDAATDVYTKKVDFEFANFGVNGGVPFGSLLQASNGKLYGMTYDGGASGLGVLFEYDPNSNVYVKKFDFSGSTGNRPRYGNLIEVNLSTTCISSTIPTLATTNSSICIGSSSSLSISSGSLNGATNWQWYSGSCGGTYVGSGTSITVTPATTTTYYARGEGGCVIPGACASITVTVNPSVNAGTVTGTSPICVSTSTTFSSNGNAGGTWSSSDNAIATVNPGTGLVTAIAPGTANIIYTINVGCGAPASASAPITLAGVAAPVVTGLNNVCSFVGTGATVTYNASSTGATSYNWTLPPNVQLQGGQGTANLTVSFLSGFTTQPNKQLKVTATSVCGVSAPTIFYLLAQLPNTPGTITASSTNVCAVLATGSITYSIAPVVGATSYIWSAQPGVIITPAGSGVQGNTVTASFPNTFTTSAITVRSVNDCGTSSARSITVTRNNPSTPGLISGPTMVCPYILPNGIPATYSVAAVANAATYTWVVPQGSTVISGQGTNSISFIYPPGFVSGTISVSTSNGCGNSGIRNLNISTLSPGTPSIIDQTITSVCPNRTCTYALANLPANAVSVNWTASIGTILSGNGTTSITVSYPATAINAVITAQAVSNCGQSVVRSTTVRLPACAAPPPPPFAKSTTQSNSAVSDALSVNVYPNPTTTDFKLQVLTAGKEEISVKVLDMTGRFYKQLTVMPYQTINLGAELKAGAYMLEVKQGGVRKVVRVVKF
jgi:uncharacterized repeat protein (TIGR03803 family)